MLMPDIIEKNLKNQKNNRPKLHHPTLYNNKSPALTPTNLIKGP